MRDDGTIDPQPRFQFNNLTAARFVAALLVVLHHLAPVLKDPAVVQSTWVRQFCENGYVGVTFFFILSGFVISAASFERLRRPCASDVLRFFGRRVVRIVPVWLFLSLPLVVAALQTWPPKAGLLQYLTFTQAWSGDGHVVFGYLAVAWTLSCEMFFYAMFPLVAFVVGRWLQRDRNAGLWLVLAAVAVTAAVTLYFVDRQGLYALNMFDPDNAHRWLYRMPIVRFTEFLVGVGLFLMFERYRGAIRDARHRWRWIALLAVSCAALAAIMATLPFGVVSLTAAYVVPFAFVVFALAAVEANAAPLAVASPLFILLGEASYSLYLMHQQYGLPFIAAIAGGRPSLPTLAWSLVLVVCISVGLYKLVEEPSRQYLNAALDRVLRPRRKPLEADPAPAD